MFSLLGPARPSIFSPSSLEFFAFFFLATVREGPPPAAANAAAASSSSLRIASCKAGIVSQSASYPRRMLALRFCSDCMWLARFCDADSS